MTINRKKTVKISNRGIIFLLFVFILLFSFFYAIHSNNPHKGHDFYGAGSISVGLNRFSPYWYLGTYFYLMHPFGFNFLVFLPFKTYLGSILYWKFFFMFFYLLSFLTCYLFAFEITKSRSASFVSALVYLFNPYHLVESIIEGHGMLNAALALSPLCFYLAEKVIEFPNLKNSLALGLSLGLIMYTHPNVAFIFFPFILFYTIFRSLFISEFMKKRIFYILLLPMIIATLVGANFWLPLLLYKNLFFSTSFSLEDSKAFTVNLLHVATLHPISCCLPNSVNFFNNCFIKICSFAYPIFVPVSVLLVERNNRKKLLTLTIILIMYILSLLISAGLKSPVPLYKFLFKYVPLFNAIRVPLRFLFINSLCLSLIIGIGIIELLKILKTYKLKLLFIASILLIFLYIPHKELKYAFQTFKIPKNLQELYTFLYKQKYGRVFVIPIDSWIYTSEWRNIVNPLLWTFMYNKESVSGGAPNFSTRYIGDYLNFINWRSKSNHIDINEFDKLYNIKYIVIDKKNSISKNFKIGNSIKKIFENNRYIVYLNDNIGDVFLLVSKKRLINIDNTKFIIKKNKHILLKKNSDKSLTVSYNFDTPQKDKACFSIFMSPLNFSSYYDELYIKYKICNISFNNLNFDISLTRIDGFKYYIKWQTFEGDEGYIRVPIILLQGADKNKEKKLDLKFYKLSICVNEKSNFYKNKKFSIKFSNLAIFNNKIVPISYIKNDKSEYIIILNKNFINNIKKNLENNFKIYIVLNYAYFPNWTAQDNNNIISHYRVLHFLNGFELNKRELFHYNKIYIKYKNKKLENISSIISIIISIITILILSVPFKLD